MLTEGKKIEYKSEYTESIKKTVIAFANCGGGVIYVGIDDNGIVKGIPEIDSVMLQVTNSIRDSIRPDVTLFTEVDVEQKSNQSILVIRVQTGTARPYYLVGKGIRPEGVFIRQGSSTVPATDSAILKMIKEASGDCYENARSLVQRLTFNFTTPYFEKKDLAFKDAQKKTLHLISEDGMYTNLGLLFSDQCPHSIKLAVFQGEKKTVFKERREFSGSVLNQLEDAYAFIDRFNSTRAEFKGLERIDIRDYPSEAIRESLLNAIVHRDYSFGGSTLISIYDDRMEIITIGGLVKGISLDDIMLGFSILRNQHLANVFYRLKLIEAYGTGVPKIISAYTDYPVKVKIEATDNAFKITLPNINSKSEHFKREAPPVISEREKTVLSLFEDKEFVLRKDLEEAIGISQSTAIILLGEMVEKGLLKKIDSGKLTKYQIKE